MQNISFTTHLFKEGDMFVAHVPELDISSCGYTADEARKNIGEAVRGFLETSNDKGTLQEILKEAGYEQRGEEWKAPEFVALDRLTLTF